MDSTLPKKMNVLMLLEVLKKHTDAGHTLSLTEIGELVIREYSVKLDRHAVKSNLMNLVDFGYPVLYDETTRRRKNGEEEVICTDWYYEHDITDPELHILIDGLLFSKYIPYSQCKALVGKLEGLSSKHFRHRHRLPENQPENRHLLLTVEVLNEAITAGRRVAFSFVTYSPDKEPHFVTDRDGTPHAYKVSPYEIVVAGGRYYLICAHAKGELFHYNLDYIRDIKLLDHERSRPVRDVPGCERGFDLAAYMKEHIHMYSGKSETVTFRAYLRADDKGNIITQILDWFGKDVRLTHVTEDAVTATARVNENAMLYWALQYGQSVEILSPESLRERVRDVVRGMAKRYEKEEPGI